MAKVWTLVVLVALLAGGIERALGQSRPPADTRDALQRGMDAFGQKRYGVAVRELETFLRSSAGDPRAEKARKVLHDARLGLIKENVQAGRATEAARLYMALAEEAGSSKESKEGYIKSASQLLTTSLADAQKKRAWDSVVEIDAAWKKYFPDKPALLTDEQAREVRMDLLLALCEDKFNQLTLPDLLERWYPDGKPPMEELTKRNRGVPVSAGYFKALADIGWTGRYLAERQRLEENSPLRTDKNFAAQTERMLVRRAEAFALMGNVPEARKALAAAKPEATSSASLATIKTIESKIPPDVSDALGGGGERKLRDLTFDQPVKGKTTWSDKGEGFGEAKSVVLDEGAEITVAAGTIINGGKITLRHARIKLAGEPNRPVILRNVRLEQEIGSELEAQNAVLEGCTFTYVLAGQTVPFNATKWSFNESILYRCRFTSMMRGSVGLRINNCGIVESEFPDRFWQKSQEGVLGSDGYNGTQSCLFVGCRIHLSALWLSKNCNFVSCTISKLDWVSYLSLAVPLHMPPGDPNILGLPAGMLDVTTGEIQYSFSRRPFEVKIPGSLWALLPVEVGGAQH